MNFRILSNKVILYTRGKVCETPDELFSSPLFHEILTRFLGMLREKRSPLLETACGGALPPEKAVPLLVETMRHLAKLPASVVPNVVSGAELFLRDIPAFSRLVEQLYNYWRAHDRFIVCDSEGDSLDRRPYRTFNETVERMTHLVRGAYRDIDENLTSTHPRIYRQLAAGAQVAAISLPRPLQLPGGLYEKLARIRVIRQVLINPPLILNPPINRRAGQFIRVDRNPLEVIDPVDDEWLCYPAKVGPLLILIYFHAKFFELGFSLCNLFEIADDDELTGRPDAIYLFGVPGDALDALAEFPTMFHEDREGGMLVAAVPNRDEFGYFGYLKKMVLTLHNIRMMQAGRLPFHGAFVQITMDDTRKNILIIGDTGAGKSETLEAFRTIGGDDIRDMTVIADDMGSLDIDDGGDIVGYGTEIGAFLRLDDLQPGYAFGQIDRSIIMSPAQVNARIILPVTTCDTIMKGHRVDMVLYANNYEQVDDDHPIIERFGDVDRAFSVFREGMVMSKGTTTSTGIVHSYFANIFGPPQYRDIHDRLAMVFFNAFFNRGVFVGQMRTRLGITGYEMRGPEEAAGGLLRLVRGRG
ncbi:MAG: phosphoenolpyruvate carboxykinase [Spirochaetota bacterium]|jgi:hypothetical protein